MWSHSHFSDLDSVFVEINIFSLSEINAFCTRNIEEQHIVPNIISDKYSDRYRHCTRYYQKTNLNLFRLSFSLFSCIRFREIRNTDISSRDQVFFFSRVPRCCQAKLVNVRGQSTTAPIKGLSSSNRSLER